ncbi:MAG TPA: DNA-3-methyladenine glycosylase I [Candidatus Saccharimonadales bacterium]|nr:DNA-3-methyladenine glycosylase I [Candidatus Saccharimonadales bacterium]
MKTAPKKRCPWAESNEELMGYHDVEWGRPLHDDHLLFEFLSLEGAQAGLSWLTILKRREGYRAAFKNFAIETVARYCESDIQQLLQDERIIRNQLKIRSVVNNAKKVIQIQKDYGSLDEYFWQFVSHQPIKHHFDEEGQIPAMDEISLTISKDLKKRGLTFVGPTIIYAHMQATGMVNDHLVYCFKYQD